MRRVSSYGRARETISQRHDARTLRGVLERAEARTDESEEGGRADGRREDEQEVDEDWRWAGQVGVSVAPRRWAGSTTHSPTPSA